MTAEQRTNLSNTSRSKEIVTVGLPSLFPDLAAGKLFYAQLFQDIIKKGESDSNNFHKVSLLIIIKRKVNK